MKKLLLLAIFTVFGCQPLSQTLKLPTDKFEEEQPVTETHQQFESRDLVTPKTISKKIQVALFLPFSGRNKELSWNLFNSALLSLFENDLNHNIELVLIDSKDTARETKKAFQEIINRKIKVVIGPIFGSLVEEIAKDAIENKITVISLSNNQELMGKINDEGGIFLAGILPEAQVDKIVSYSLQQGKYNFAIIAPNDNYGMTINNIFKKIIKSRDGNFITSAFYKTKASDSDLQHTVSHVINSFTIPEHLKVKKNLVLSESDRIYPQVIIIPESGRILSDIVATIKKQNKDERDFQIIGTSQWDTISTLNDHNLIGAWFAAPQNEKFSEFEKTYYQIYNKFPPRISSIIYDIVTAVAMIAEIKKDQNLKIQDFTSYAKPPKNGFEGIDGLFRFLPNGLVQRNLAVLEVNNGRFETLEKPVEQFLKY
jgi:ABC-type branched-subunit amino acid transport system substrate-binding protein